MIKISLRQNIIYLLFLFVSYYLRRVLMIILGKVYQLNYTLFFCFLMCLGEIVGGSSIYLYQKKYYRNKDIRTNSHRTLIYNYSLIETQNSLIIEDNKHKIRLLIFFAAFFDLEEVVLTSYIVDKFKSISKTASIRLNCIMTIISSLTCFFTLRLKVVRHQICCLIIMFFLACIVIILELLYKSNDISYLNYILGFLLILGHYLSISFTDVIHKYLVDYDYINPFKIIMAQGIIGILLLCLYSIFQNPLNEISNIYKEVDNGKFILLVFLLFLFSVISLFVNVYKILSNVLFSPVTKSLATYFFISPFIIFHYIEGDDFLFEGKKDLFYFLINLIICIIIDFVGLIYNEIMILYCCGLSKETHEAIYLRSIHRSFDGIDDSIYNVNDLEND